MRWWLGGLALLLLRLRAGPHGSLRVRSSAVSALTFAAGGSPSKFFGFGRFSVSSCSRHQRAAVRPGGGRGHAGGRQPVVSWRHRMSIRRRASTSATSLWRCGSLARWSRGRRNDALINQTPDAGPPAALALMAASYFIVNSGLIAIAIGMQNRQKPFECGDRTSLARAGIWAGACVALLLVVALRQSISARWRCCCRAGVAFAMLRSSFGRLEDAKQHVDGSTGSTFDDGDAGDGDRQRKRTTPITCVASGGSCRPRARAGALGSTAIKAIEAAGLCTTRGRLPCPSTS